MKKKIALGVCCVYAALSALPACALGAPGEAADRLREARVDLAVMDCFGYSKKMRDFAAEAISRPVILSRTIAARVLTEIV